MVADIVEPGGSTAADSLAEWLKRRHGVDPGLQEVHDFILSFKERLLYRLQISDLETVTYWPVKRYGPTDPRHALGDMKAADGNIGEVQNFKTPWTYAYIFHDLMERLGHVPSWPETIAHLRGDGRPHLLDPFERHFDYPKQSNDFKTRYNTALRWRTAVAYYSFIREIDLIVRLRRDHHLPIKFNLLADAQFKIDLWCGRVLIALLISNPKFNKGNQGRKIRAPEMLDITGFESIKIELPKPKTFGLPDLVPPDAILKIAHDIRDLMS